MCVPRVQFRTRHARFRWCPDRGAPESRYATTAGAAKSSLTTRNYWISSRSTGVDLRARESPRPTPATGTRALPQASDNFSGKPGARRSTPTASSSSFTTIGDHAEPPY